MSQGRWGRWVAVGMVVLFVAIFTFLNGGERIALNLGLVVLYQVPLVVLVFLSFLLGMVAMFLFGLRHDLKVRRYLRQPFHEPPEPPPDPVP